MNVDPRARPGSPDDVGIDAFGPNGPGVLVLDQRFDIDDLYQVRAAVAAHAAEIGLSLELANDVVIAVHELASNSVRHGPGCGRLRIWTDRLFLICEIADGVLAGQDHAEPAEPPGASPDANGLPWPVESGHGLWLVGKVADRFAVRCDDLGATATATFAVGP
jgi:anti-sigma regulatory factor (Ser/Thr protein kinase)